MAHDQQTRAEAERLYVYEQETFTNIAGQLGISDRAVRYWAEEGQWQDKRINYRRSRQAFHEELYEFTRLLMRKIKEKIEAGEEPSQSSMYAFVNLLPKIVKVKDYEDAKGQAETKGSADGLSDDALGVVRDLLGL